MTFNSLSFFLFLPAAAVLYLCAPRKWQNAVLLCINGAFYWFNAPGWLPVLVLDSLVTWALVRRMHASRGRARKGLLWSAVALNIGLIVLCKAAGAALRGAAVADGLWRVLEWGKMAGEAGVQPFSLILPLGLSFFTVQSVGWAVDVYRGKGPADATALEFMLFTSFFALIQSGPIMRGHALLGQFRAEHRFDAARAPHALVTMALGYLCKVAVADTLAVYVNAVFAAPAQYTGLTLTGAAVGYGLQLYFDFSGYSLLALGCAELLGFALMRNFDTPYFSCSVKEFWGRWHISFSSWLRDYVYIPLGGNRKGKARKYLNLLLTFLVSGMWHGTGLTFLVWGALHGIYQIAGDVTNGARAKLYAALGLRRTGRLARIWQCAFVFVLVDAAWVFFRAASIADALHVLTAQFVNISPQRFASDLLAILTADFNPTVLLACAFAAFCALATAFACALDGVRRFRAPGGDLAAWILALPALRRWALYYLLAGCVFAGFILNNGYFSTAVSFIYNNF